MQTGPANTSGGPVRSLRRQLIAPAVGVTVPAVIAIEPVIPVGPVIGPVVAMRIVAVAAVVVAGLLDRRVRHGGTIRRGNRRGRVGLAGDGQWSNAHENGAQDHRK